MTPSPSWHVRAEKLPTVFKPPTAFHSLHHGCRKQLSTTKRHTRCFQVRDYHTTLVRLKDALNPAKQDGVVYSIRCVCGSVYIGGTGRSMQKRIKEHERDIRLAKTQTYAFSELPQHRTLERSKVYLS